MVPLPVPTTQLIAAALFFSVLTNLLMLTGPLFMMQVYDRVLASRSEETLVALFGLVAGLYLIYGLLEYARGRVVARYGADLQSQLNAPVFRAVVARAALRRGGVPGAVGDLEAVRTLFSSPVLLALFDLPWTPIFFGAIFILHPTLGWLSLAGGALLIVVAIANQLLTMKKTIKAQQFSAAAQGFTKRSEEGSELVRAQGMTGVMTDRFAATSDKAVEQALRSNDWTGSFSSFTKAFRLFLQSAMLAAGAWLVLREEMTPGAMIAGSILLGRALAPIDVGVSQWPVVQRARKGWSDIKALLLALPEEAPATELPVPEARLQATGLSVIARRGDAPILSQVGFEVQPGEALGIIGRSGSGKTTLARVIVGLIIPATGQMRLGGATLDQYGADRLGHHIGYLPQDIRLFDGTVAENIARMAIQPDAQAVVAAARKARVHEVILSLPDGYDTKIGMADAQLSGGQKQRLALARALYGDPVLLVLDEPNSALDADGSEALNAAVLAMKTEGKAVVIMTHRPQAISHCDKLLVLDKGRVTAFGPRDEVLQKTLRNAQSVQTTLNPAAAS